MIKTIKVKKSFRLDELIKYVRDNRVREKTFRINEHGNTLKVDEDGLIETYFPNMHLNNSFTVEVEEEITEDTTFERLVSLGCRGTINVHDDKSLSDLSGKKEYGAQVFALINGKLELIWEAE